MILHEEIVEGSKKQLFPKRVDSLGYFQATVVMIKRCIGSGPLKLGNAFRCGAILAPLMNTLIGILSTYTLFLFTKACSHVHGSTFEDIWHSRYGTKTLFISAFISIYSAIIVSKNYVSFVVSSITSIILQFYEEAPEWMTTTYFLMAVVFVLFMVPVSLSSKLKLITILCDIGVACIVLLMVFTCYWLAFYIERDGFDPLDQIVMFRFDKTAIKCLSSLLTSYLIQPIAYPGIRHFAASSEIGIMKVFASAMFFSWIAYNVFGLFQYLTFFDGNAGASILTYYEDGVIVLISNFLVVIMMLPTLVLAQNQARYLVLNSFFSMSDFPKIIWALVGIAISLLTIILSTLSSEYSGYIGIIYDCLSPFRLFILPAFLYLSTRKMSSMINFIGSIGIIILGFASIAFILYNYIDSQKKTK